MKRTLIILTLSLAVGLAGCGAQQAELKEARLTVGKVQGEIMLGLDAAKVAELLGSPNIVTTDEKRRTKAPAPEDQAVVTAHDWESQVEPVSGDVYRWRCFRTAAQRMMRRPIQRPARWKGIGSRSCSSFSSAVSSPVVSVLKITV